MVGIRRDDWQTLKPTVYGWGINDVNYIVQLKRELPKKSGKRQHEILWVCPYYEDWRNMIQRCKGVKYQDKRPTYKGCTICSEWQYLSNFIKWVDSQPNCEWSSCALDKDILIGNNKHYSPETVVYVSQCVNGFICCTDKSRGNLLLGVSPKKTSKLRPFQAQCSDPFGRRSKYIGSFPTELEAHKAWQGRKHEYALALSLLQGDERVKYRLSTIFSPDKDWTKR